MPNLDNSEDILDARDVIARVEELEEARDDEDGTGLSDDEAQELASLSAFLEQMKGYGGDEEWRGDWYPVTLVRDSYFTDYAQELVEDCGYISKDFPSWIEVDWQATARNVQIDYTSADFGGVTYWFR